MPLIGVRRGRVMSGWSVLLCCLLAALVAGCGPSGGSSQASPTSASGSPGTVKVLYAGSLVNLMETGVSPGFHTATGGRVAGEAGGSQRLVSEITGKVKRADVFVSASTKANTPLLGASHGGWEAWYATFATSPLVIAYNPHSRFAAALKSKPWQQVIAEPGFRMGTTDPKLDPKGKLAAAVLHRAGINPATIAQFPEAGLLGRLQSGQLDAGFFYTVEATQAHLPTIALGGKPVGATYTVSILHHARNPTGAAAFIRYLLGPAGRKILTAGGLKPAPVTVTGNRAAVPTGLKPTLGLK